MYEILFTVAPIIAFICSSAVQIIVIGHLLDWSTNSALYASRADIKFHEEVSHANKPCLDN